MIELILGGMFSGKTTELLRRVRRHEIAGKRVLCFKHTLDCLRAQNELRTHDFEVFNTIPVGDIERIRPFLEECDVVAVDEVQFFDDTVVDFFRSLSGQGKTLILAGLDMDYKGVPFKSMGALCCIADKVTKLHAVCMDCGRDAKYSYRKTNELELVSIGAGEKYEALCERCYLKRSGTKYDGDSNVGSNDIIDDRVDT